MRTSSTVYLSAAAGLFFCCGPSTDLRHHHHLAKLLLRLQPLVRRANLRQRINLVDHRLQLPAEDELQPPVQSSHGPHERSQQRKLAAEEETQIDLRVESGGGAARD